MVLDFIAGCFGGLAGVLVGHPLDTVKVHLQTQDVRNPAYRGIWHCVSSLVAKDGVRSLYRGITSPMAGIGGVNAIVFGIYGNVQRRCEDPHSLRTHALAGAIAGFFQSFVCSPVELAKTRLQLGARTDQGVPFRGPSECMKYILKTEGIVGSFRGLNSTIIRDVPSFIGYFVSYEHMMRMSDSPTAIHSFMAGGFAGICSWSICYPTDVVKSLIQADGMDGKVKYKGFADCVLQNYRQYGLQFFFRGFTSTLVRAFPVNAACFSVVALFMRLTKGSGIDVVVHNNEPHLVIGLDSAPFAHVYEQDVTHEIRHKRDLMGRYLRAFGTFHEAVCHSDIEDIVNEFYPDVSKYYYGTYDV